MVRVRVRIDVADVYDAGSCRQMANSLFMVGSDPADAATVVVGYPVEISDVSCTRNDRICYSVHNTTCIFVESR